MLAIHIIPEMLRPLEAALAATGQCRLAAMPLSATAFLALDLPAALRRTVVVVADSMHSLDELHRNLLAFAGTHAERILYYPAWETMPGRDDGRRTPDAGRQTGAEGLPSVATNVVGAKEGHRKQPALQTDVIGARLQCLAQLRAQPAPVVIATCVQALMQMALAPAVLQANTFRLRIGVEDDPDALSTKLAQSGYAFEPEVQDRGQAAWRGGILDIWPLTEDAPVRVEFCGSAVATLHVFDPASQRSGARLKEIVVPPAHEWPLMRGQAGACCAFLHYLPKNVLYLWSEPLPGASLPEPARPGGILYHSRIYQETLDEYRQSRDETTAGGLTLSFAELGRILASNPQAWQCFPDINAWSTREAADVAAAWPPPAPLVELGFRPMSALAAPRRDLAANGLAPDIFAEHRRRWLANLADRARQGLRTHFFFYTQGGLDRFRELHPDPAFHLHVGILSDGFLHPELQLAVVSESDFLGRPKLLPDHAARPPLRARKALAAADAPITDWTRLEPGNLVVHLDHGIGRYLGLNEIVFPSSARRSPDSPGGRDEGGNGQRQEALAIEYAGKARLYVPVSQAHLLSRYVGVGKHAPALHRLGSARWTREKDSAERAVHDLAAGLLETQAAREALVGFAFPPDTPWQNEFEASFPYQETEDQDRAIRDVKRDMEASRPMDRLICGDVGYGKTEVAMRAAFKCVMSGKQVALLVPTTVLAQQHYEVFAERMAAYPVRVELLCRFRSPREQAAVVQDLAAGRVDIVIGTHRLIQPDVRFQALGLVMIDEEQRFGVGHKERLKHLQPLVDVLTLTATPIPRTLYMSLTGAREISMIQTSPKARLPIETIVAQADDRAIRDAVLRELNRGGQVYYLHNRVHSIERVRSRLEKLVPEARLAVGHGQMATADLARIMRDFARGSYDLLLCTTIIESGLDIPNVNTILIDRADRFGMADLYQLRGRVGRSSRKAYAYMLLPVHASLLDGARQRLQAIMTHTELGAGFRLAMRDLEIRGAGNLLGPEQSGHIAAIGFELYCQLLRHTIAHMALGAGAAPVTPLRLVNVDVSLDFLDLSSHNTARDSSATLPVAYVEDERLRVGVYRQIASAASLAEIDGLRQEFRDRFGPLPPPLERLLKIASLRILATEKNITAIEAKAGKIMFRRKAELLQINRRFPRLHSAGADAQLDEIHHWLTRVDDNGLQEH